MSIKLKSPAFQFYTSDWLGSERVALMTLAEEGAYIRLLCYCWNNGSIPNDDIKLQFLLGKGASATLVNNVKKLFEINPKNEKKLIHFRLEIERKKQKKWSEKSKKGGIKSAELRKKNGKMVINKNKNNDLNGSTTLATKGEPPLQPNGNTISSSISISSIPITSSITSSKKELLNTSGDDKKKSPPKKKKNKIFDHDSWAYKLSKFQLEGIKSNDPGFLFDEAKIQHNAIEMDRLIKIDKREPEEIGHVIKWIAKDDFNKSIVLCAAKLKKRYVSLRQKYMQSKPKNKQSINNNIGKPKKKIDQKIDQKICDHKNFDSTKYGKLEIFTCRECGHQWNA